MGHPLRAARRVWAAQTGRRDVVRPRLAQNAGVPACRGAAGALAKVAVDQAGGDTSGVPRGTLRAVQRRHGVRGGHVPQLGAAAGDGLRVGPRAHRGRDHQRGGVRFADRSARVHQRGVARRVVRPAPRAARARSRNGPSAPLARPVRLLRKRKRRSRSTRLIASFRPDSRAAFWIGHRNVFSLLLAKLTCGVLDWQQKCVLPGSVGCLRALAPVGNWARRTRRGARTG